MKAGGYASQLRRELACADENMRGTCACGELRQPAGDCVFRRKMGGTETFSMQRMQPSRDGRSGCGASTRFMRRGAVAAKAAWTGAAMAGTGFVHELGCAADECVLHAGSGGGACGAADAWGCEDDAMRRYSGGRRGCLWRGAIRSHGSGYALGGLLVEAKLTEGDFQTRAGSDSGGVPGLRCGL